MKTLYMQRCGRSGRMAGWAAILLSGAALVLSVTQASETLDFPVYKPPCRGAPVTRIGGGTRGMRDNIPSIHVLAPKHTGQTSQAQPVLFWHVSQSMPGRFDFVLISEDDDEPLVEARIDGEQNAGFHRISLSDYGISLEVGLRYQWSVSMMPSIEQDSVVEFAKGKVKRIELDDADREGFKKTSGERQVAAYASAGLWYDALQVLTELIQADPGNARLQQVMMSLLQQIGLDGVVRDVAR